MDLDKGVLRIVTSLGKEKKRTRKTPFSISLPSSKLTISLVLFTKIDLNFAFRDLMKISHGGYPTNSSNQIIVK